MFISPHRSDVVVPGDYLYIRNKKWDKTWPKAIAGENLVYLGKDKFWGHITNRKKRIQGLKAWTGVVSSWKHLGIKSEGVVKPRIGYPHVGLLAPKDGSTKKVKLTFWLKRRYEIEKAY